MAALFLLIILEDFHATPGRWKRNEVRENGCVQYKRNGDGGKFSRCNIFFSFPFESTHRNRRWRDRDKNGERLVPFRESECRTSQFLEARRLLWFLSFLSLAGHNAYLHPPRLVPLPANEHGGHSPTVCQSPSSYAFFMGQLGTVWLSTSSKYPTGV